MPRTAEPKVEPKTRTFYSRHRKLRLVRIPKAVVPDGWGGQMTRERFISGAERSYDTRGMVFEKHSEDPFRHWVLGLGSGDLRIVTSGANREELLLPNVLFVDRKVREIQKLIAVKPESVPPGTGTL